MAAPPLRIARRFKSGERHVVDLLRPDGRRLWVFGSTAEEAETRAAEEIAAEDRKARPQQ